MGTNVWWVNQGRSYADEIGQEIIFAGTDRRKIRHHLVLGEMEVGDITLHYVSGYLRDIGVVIDSAITTERPYLVPMHPIDTGYLVGVKYFRLNRRIPLAEIPGHRVGAGPFDRNGKVKQGYAFGVSSEWSAALRAVIENECPVGSPWAMQAGT